MKKSFFAGLLVSLLGIVVLIVAFYALYMNSGTRLLYENSVWGARWRYYPWIFLTAAVVLIIGGALLKIGYVPKAKRTKKTKPARVRPAVKTAVAPSTSRPMQTSDYAAPLSAVPMAAPSSETSLQGRICPSCGTVNEGQNSFCEKCGFQLKKSSDN